MTPHLKVWCEENYIHGHILDIPQNWYHKATYLSWMVNRYLNTNFLKKQNWFCILISSLLYFRIHEKQMPKQNPGGVGCSLNYEQGSCINAIYYLSKASGLDMYKYIRTNLLVLEPVCLIWQLQKWQV